MDKENYIEKDPHIQAAKLYSSFSYIDPNMLQHSGNVMISLPKSSYQSYGHDHYTEFRIALISLYSDEHCEYGLEYHLNECLKYIHPDEKQIFMSIYRTGNPIWAAKMYKLGHTVGSEIKRILF